MKNKEQGFTLIELTIVIVILGILAAVAVPLYFDMRSQAAGAAVKGVAGGLSSGSATNYAAYKAGVSGYKSITNCTSAATVLQGGLPSTEYVITDSAVTADVAATCTLTYTKNGTDYTSSFTTIGVP